MAARTNSSEFYRQLFEAVSDAIFVYDPDAGTVVDANPAAATLTGYSIETLRGNPVTQFSAGTPEDVERAVIEIIDQATRGDQRFEWLIERGDGEIRTTEVSLHRTTIDDEDRVLAIMRDITEREQARADLEESRRRLSLLTQSSPDVFWMFSPDWEECLFINDAYEAVWGRSTDALMDDPSDFLAGVHPDDRETVRTAMERLSNGSRINIEYRVNEGEDFERWVWVEGIPIFDEEGTLTRHVGFARDITERKRLEAQMAEQNQQLSALTDNVPLILFELDADGVFVQSTGRGLRDLGREPGEAVGQSVFDVYADNEAICDACRRALDGESVQRTVDVGDYVFDAWYEPIRNDAGTVDGIIGVAVNVTDRQQLQAELRANERALTDLHTRAARTNLSMDERIRMFLDIGRERMELEYGFMTRIEGETHTLVEVVGPEDGLQAGQSGPLENVYCRRAIEEPGLLGIQDAPAEGWQGDPAYEQSGLSCYLGGKLIVNDELYGTVCFADTEARDRPFSESEKAFAELLVQWLGYELERNQYENSLQELTDDLTTVLDASPLAIVQLDADKTIERWNATAESFFGIPAAEAIGAYESVIPQALQPEFDSLFDRVMDGHLVEGYEFESERRAGTVFSIDAAPIPGPAGDPNGVVAVFMDVTEQRRRRNQIDALREAAQRLVGAHSIEEVGTIAVETTKDALGFPVCAMWRYDHPTDSLRPVTQTTEAVELVGETPVFERNEGLAWSAFDTGRVQRYEDVHREADIYDPASPISSEVIAPIGEYGLFIASSPETAAFDDTDVQLVETLASTLEDTLERIAGEQQLRENERELRRQNEQLDEFASVVAHDIRGPLTAARGYFELALETQDDAHFERVERAHARMERLIDDLLTLARQGKSIAEREPIDLVEVAREAWPHVRSDATLELEDGLPDVEGDPSRLEEVFSNLFRNAVEHAGADVTVSVGPLSDDPGFYIADDGPGIPQEKLPHLFDFGYTTSATGTGLGLAISEEIVEAHGWTMTAMNGPDGGARFEIHIGESAGTDRSSIQ
ncbi:MAG: PAS domain S-box protein [Halobacteriales archaeon]